HGISRWWLTAAWAARPGLPGEVNARRTIPAQNLKNRWTVLADSILLPAPVAYRERISRGKIGNLSRISRDPRAAGAEGRGRAGGVRRPHGLHGRIPAGRPAVARRWQVAGSASAPRSPPAQSTAAAAPRAWAAPTALPPPRPDLVARER